MPCATRCGRPAAARLGARLHVRRAAASHTPDGWLPLSWLHCMCPGRGCIASKHMLPRQPRPLCTLSTPFTRSAHTFSPHVQPTRSAPDTSTRARPPSQVHPRTSNSAPHPHTCTPHQRPHAASPGPPHPHPTLPVNGAYSTSSKKIDVYSDSNFRSASAGA